MMNGPFQGPRRLFKIGRYQFAWAATTNRLRNWECSDGCRGVGPCWTPWGAFIALKRWQKQPARPS